MLITDLSFLPMDWLLGENSKKVLDTLYILDHGKDSIFEFQKQVIKVYNLNQTRCCGYVSNYNEIMYSV